MEHGYTDVPELVPKFPLVVHTTTKTKTTTAKKWINKPIRVRKILELQRFNWNDCYNSFALALYGALQYSNKTITLPQALVYTRQAFTINTDTTVGPMDVFGDGSLLKAALNNLGFDMKVLAANIYGGEWEEDSVDKALFMVRESIQRGMGENSPTMISGDVHRMDKSLIQKCLCWYSKSGMKLHI